MALAARQLPSKPRSAAELALPLASSKVETYKLFYEWVRAVLLNAVCDATKIQKGIKHRAFSLMVEVILFNNLGSLCFSSLNS